MPRRVTSIQRQRWATVVALVAILLQLASASLHQAAMADAHGAVCSPAAVSVHGTELCGHAADMQHHAAPHDAGACPLCQATQHAASALSVAVSEVPHAPVRGRTWRIVAATIADLAYVAPSAPRAPPACV